LDENDKMILKPGYFPYSCYEGVYESRVEVWKNINAHSPHLRSEGILVMVNVEVIGLDVVSSSIAFSTSTINS
jgi:hypothetical protein